jgi:DNA repair protein RadD
MSFTLRPYQEEITEELRQQMRQGVKSILLQLATGGGKTVITANMLHKSASRGFSSLFIMHRRELIKQTIRTFNREGLKHGVIAAGFPENPKELVQIASIQTLAKRLKYARVPKLIVWDECSHCAASTWNKIHEFYKDSYHIGLTATPARLDNKGLGKYFQEMIHGPSVRWLIENKYLSDYRIYAPSTINLKGIHTRMGDYAKDELNSAMDKPSITGDAVDHYKRIAMGKRAVVFAVSIVHSKNIVEQFNKEGIPSAHVDGETPVDIRDYTIEKFRHGKIQVLSNVDLFSEGFDLPSLEVAILLRPTQSVSLHLQQIGRVLRHCEGKEFAIILDHASNTLCHGLPDEERQWSLSEGLIRKKDDEKQIKIKTCPKCYGVQAPFNKICKFCGHEFEIQSREVDQKDGELIEVDLERIRNEQMMKQTVGNELWQAQTHEQLVELGRKRLYKYPEKWAWFIMKSRQAKKLQKAEV